MAGQYGIYPLTGGVPVYPTLSAFPPTASNGSLAVAGDTDTLYVYSTSAMAWEAIGGTAVPLGVGAYNSQPTSVNGLTIANNLIYAQSATAVDPGMVTVGNLTESTSSVLSITGGTGSTIGSGTTIQVKQASTSQSGYLSNTDWNTFNNKQPAGSYITALTGDMSATGPGSVVSTLATVNGSPGSFTYASLTVNGKGLVTAASSGVAPVTTLSAVGSSPNANAGLITGNTLNLEPFSSSFPGVVTASGGGSVNFLRADGTWAAPSGTSGITSLTGDVTATGPGAAAATLATVNASPGSFTYASLTVNGKGLVTAASNGTAPVTTLSAVGASPNANAGTITGNTLNLQPFNSSNPGVVIASGGGTTNFLRADGTWAAPTATSPTSNYWSGYNNVGAWTTTSSSYVDGTNANGNTLVTRISHGITVTTPAGTVNGITFTPASSSSIYIVTATFQGRGQTGGATAVWKMTDGTNDIAASSVTSGTTGDHFQNTLTGPYAPGTGSSVTVKIQIAAIGGGTTEIQDATGGLANTIEWNLFQIA